MADNIERVVSVIYQLYSSTYGLKTVIEPKGYESDTRGYTRDSDSKGFLVKTEIDLEFFGDGADYLYTLYKTKGIQEKCTLTKYEVDKYSLSETLKVRYIQELDLGTLKRDEGTGGVTVNATEGGLYTDIKNRESDEYDLINTQSADDVFIDAISTKVFKPQPRSLFLESLLEGVYDGYRLNTVRRNASGGIARATKTVPLDIVYYSGDNINTPFNYNESNNTFDDSESIYLNDVEDVGNIFYWRSDIGRSININIELDYCLNKNTYKDNVYNNVFRVVLKKSEIDVNDDTNDIITDIDVLESFDMDSNIGVKKSLSIPKSIYLEKGESLSLCFEVYGTVGFSQRAVIQAYVDVSKSKLAIEDDEDYPITESRCIKVIDFFDRIIAKITGKSGLVESTVFDDGGEYENIVIDNGLWARQFPDTYTDSSDEEQTIQMKSSFKDAFESLSYLEPLCWFTYFEGNEEKVRIEKATYTQQNFIGLDLSYVDDIKSEVSKVDFFSNVKLGHSESMEYEEISGLDEPNGLSEFSTFITKSTSTYEVSSKIRTDAVGYELVRRKSFLEYPKEDTSRDDNLWMHDAKKLNDGSYTHNLWNDSINGVQLLDELPKGVFRPDNLWNFRLSPMNRLFYGHGYSIKRGLYHYPSKKIIFSSSNANQNLSTKSNGYELKESEGVLVGDLPKARVEAEKISFTFKMTQLIENELLGNTKVNGLLVPNYFGLIKYKDNGDIRYGRLIKLETKDEAKMTVIKARI